MQILASQLPFLANRNAELAVPPLFWPDNCIKIGGHVALLSGPTVYTLYCGYVFRHLNKELRLRRIRFACWIGCMEDGTAVVHNNCILTLWKCLTNTYGDREICSIELDKFPSILQIFTRGAMIWNGIASRGIYIPHMVYFQI